MASLAQMKQQHQQQQGGDIARKSDKDKSLMEFLSGDSKIEKAIAAVAGKFFTPDRFLRLAINAVKKTPLLMYCDPHSVLGAFMTSAALGLEPNTILQQAFLIPYRKRARKGNDWVDVYECNFQIGARGFVTLAHRSPHIATLQSEAIHENDLFEHMQGTETFLKYKKSLKERGALIGAFCFTKMADGNEMATVLPLDEVHKIRGKSETYNALLNAFTEAMNGNDGKATEKARKKLDETPWVMWEDDMAAKSATKKHSKQLPLAPGDAFAVAAQIDADDGKTIDMSMMTDPDLVRAVMSEGVDAADAGGTGGEAFGAAASMLEDHPSPTLNTMTTRARQAETVEAMPTAHAPSPQMQNAGDERSMVDKLKSRLRMLTDIDMLDAEADLINDVDAMPQDKDELREIYHARRADLLDGGKPAATQPPQAPQRRTAPRHMSLE